jgi:hypothetical protein
VTGVTGVTWRDITILVTGLKGLTMRDTVLHWAHAVAQVNVSHLSQGGFSHRKKDGV